MSVTIKDVREAFEMVAQTGKPLLKDNEEFVLQEGAPSVGRAWRLMVREAPSSGWAGAPCTQDRGYLGWTKREAFLELTKLAELYASR